VETASRNPVEQLEDEVRVRDRQLLAAKQAVAEASEARRRGEFVAEARRILCASLDQGVDVTLQRLTKLAITQLDTVNDCLVDLVSDDDRFAERVAAGRDLHGGVLPVRCELQPESTDPVSRAVLDCQTQVVSEPAGGSRVVAPMVLRSRVIGALSLLADGQPLDDRNRELAEQLAESAASMIDHARLFAAEKRARVLLGRLQKVTASLSNASTPEEVIEVACRISREVMEGHSTILWRLGSEGELRLAGSWGATTEFLDRFRVIPASMDIPAHRVVRTGQPIWVESEDDYRKAAPEVHARARAEGKLTSYAVFPLAADGVVRGVVAFAHPVGHLFDEEERAWYRTISMHCSRAMERASLLADAREAIARAEAANRLKDEFLSTVSHELRTPLNAITGWVHMLRSGALTHERRDHALEVIERNARLQEKVIADLLDVGRISAGRLRLSVGPVEPGVIVKTAIESVRPAAEEKGVRIIASRFEGDERVAGDAGRLHQVVCNLLTNAVKFSPVGGAIEVVLDATAPVVVLTVRDHGAGIKPEFLPKIFEPFRQAGAGMARSHGGLGLGLTISRRLVELHGGSIEASSEGEGRGAVFVIRLPAAPRETTRVGLKCQPEAPSLATGRELGGRSVLVVEDEPDTREFLLALFEACGADARGASSASDAMEQFQRERPDVIVSDVGLKGEDGLTLLRQVRRTPGGREVAAVALTAFVRSEDRDLALAAGFDEHVPKPIEPDVFLRVVTDVLRAREKERVTRTHPTTC
jgi:signal transduction histidine kinase/ActR/RegA family two-component response regulator